jgi:hypothetical protein
MNIPKFYLSVVSNPNSGGAGRRSGRRPWEGGIVGTVGGATRGGRSGAGGGTRVEAPPHPVLSLNKTIAIPFLQLDRIWKADM